MSWDPLTLIEHRLAADGAGEALIRGFRRQVETVASGATGMISEAELVPIGDLPDHQSLAVHEASGREALRATCIIKLNGGLGTGMGLEKAKSLLPVKDGLTFLDILARQVAHLRATYGAPLPLLLMNSFSTAEDTATALARHPELGAGQPGLPLGFLQNRVPKLRADTLAPAEWPADPEKEWCPPGHGDLYTALATSGMLANLRGRGIRYAFVSNADNLGALLDLRLLGYMRESGAPFLMEVTVRTEADRKGGHLARLRSGGLALRESAQCPPAEADAFQDVTRHRFFNTNNLWIDLDALADVLARTGEPPALPVIVNRKTVDPRDPASTPVVQLETAMGAAIASFPGAQAVSVPRSRFSPVKTTDDLLGLWSDAYLLDKASRLGLHPARNGRPPVVRLDAKFYKMWPDFEMRFARGVPSLIECDALTVEGDVRFGPGVRIRGRATLRAREPATAEGRVVDGSAGAVVVEL